MVQMIAACYINNTKKQFNKEHNYIYHHDTVVLLASAKLHLSSQWYTVHAGILGLKEKSECSQQGSYELPISTSDALPLSYRRVVVARPLN